MMPAKKQYMIYWATTIPGGFIKGDTAGDDKYNHRMYYVTTEGFWKHSVPPNFCTIRSSMLLMLLFSNMAGSTVHVPEG